MTHLNVEQLVDVAEGTIAEATLPHLATCARCWRTLSELRATLTDVAADSAPVPEPPPVFWATFRKRINDQIAAEPVRIQRPLSMLPRHRLWRPAVLAPLAAAAVVLLILRTGPPPSATPRPAVAPPAQAAAAPAPDQPTDVSLDDDPSLRLVAELTTTIDLDAARDAGLVAAGSAEHAVTHLNEDELRELRRLLQQELGS